MADDQTLDVVEELRLRRWARMNHVPMDDRDLSWHAVILDEMSRRDAEMEADDRELPAKRIVPLVERQPAYHSAHETSGPRFLASPQRSGELHYT